MKKKKLIYKMVYRKEIDGLRALAVIPVLLFHAGFGLFEGGYVGVDVFFVISGYLITYIILNQLSENKFSIANFYERRAKRILPPLFLVMISCYPLAYLLMAPYEIKDFGESLIATAFFGSNFLFAFESGYFQGPSEFKPLLHTWSLAVEEQYYLFYPIFLILAWSFFKNKITLILVLISLISLIACEFFSYAYPGYNFFLLPTRSWELLVGSLISIYLFKNNQSNVPPHTKYSNFFSLLGMLLVLISIFTMDHKTRFPSLITLIPVLGTGLMILFCTKKTILWRLLTNRVLVWFGLISYSLYLWHQPILVFGRMYFEDNMTAVINIALLLLSTFISFLSWKYFENPIRKSSISQRNTFISVFLCIGFFSLSHFVIQSKNGFIGKLKNQNNQFAKTLEEFAEYTLENQKKTNKRAFPINNKKNILIIGDSYSQDFINIMYESEYINEFNFSSFFISARCKNLNVSQEELQSIIDNKDKAKCAILTDHYTSKTLKDLIKKADKIILSSSWVPEDTKFIAKSIKNIGEQTEAEIYIVSTKSFNPAFYRKGIKSFIDLTKDELMDLSFHLQDEKLLVNSQINNFNYIDLTEVYCNEQKCNVSDNEGNLLSYDGSHLTKEGAIFFANRLNMDFLSLPH